MTREPLVGIGDIKNRHLTKANQQLTHDNRIRRQQGLPNLDGINTSRFVESLLPSENRRPPQTPLIREEPV